VKEKNKHIDHQLHGDYPKPGVPAEDAWADMQEMLDKALPESSVNTSSVASKLLKLGKPLSMILLVTGGIIGVYLLNTVKSVQYHIKKPALTHLKAYREEYVQGKSQERSKSIKSDTISINTRQQPKLPGADNPEINKRISANVARENFRVEENSDPLARPQPVRKLEKISNKRIKIAVPNRQDQAGQSENKLKKDDGAVQAKAEKNHSFSKRPDRFSRKYSSDGGPLDRTATRLVETLELTRESPRKNNALISEKESTKNHLQSTYQTAALSPDEHRMKITRLTPRLNVSTNYLIGKLNSVPIKQRGVETAFTPKARADSEGPFKNIHAGLLWNVNVPGSGYDTYFRGKSKMSDFYRVLLPGIWIGKTLKQGSEIIVKVKPFNQYFGNSRKTDSRNTFADSSGYLIVTKSLLKSSGINAGIQYNQAITNRLSIGLGATVQWQQKALLSNAVRSSRQDKIVDYEPYIHLTQRSDTSNYLKPYFISTNLDILYSWKQFQVGAGFVLPVSSMLSQEYKIQKPGSGQLIFRWRLK
jgi:hypothetical protein